MSRIDEIKARFEAATPGPWKATFGMDCRAFVQTPDKDEDFKIYNHANAAFIAHSRDDIPYLLAEVEQARAERDNIKLSNDGLCVSHDNLYAKLREATARAEKSEAERDTYKAALEALHINVDLLKGE